MGIIEVVTITRRLFLFYLKVKDKCLFLKKLLKRLNSAVWRFR